EPANGITVPVQKDHRLFIPALDQEPKLIHGLRPKRTGAILVALAPKLDDPRSCRVPLEVADPNASGLAGSGTRVVKEQEDRIGATPLRRRAVGSRKEGIQLSFLQIRDGILFRPLEGNGANRATPLDVLRTPLANESGKRVKRGKPLVARADRAGTLPFQVFQEAANNIPRHVLNRKTVDRLLGGGRRERNQQRHRVAVRILSVLRKIAFRNHVLQ